jgi:hypothetical protein
MNANPSIKCSVSSCSYHNCNQNACTLNEIKVGCCQSNVSKCEATECASFQLGDKGANCSH